MSTLNILSVNPVSLTEVKDKLEKVQKEKELNYRGNKTLEYSNHFIKLKPEQITELKNKLKELNIGRLKDEHIVKLIDFLPRNIEDFKIIFQGGLVTFPKEDIEKIVAAIKDYV